MHEWVTYLLFSGMWLGVAPRMAITIHMFKKDWITCSNMMTILSLIVNIIGRPI